MTTVFVPRYRNPSTTPLNPDRVSGCFPGTSGGSLTTA